MTNFRWLVWVGVLFPLAPLAGAQTSRMIAPESCVFRPGDDIRWAAANLDESGWLPISRWNESAIPEPHFWLRCTLDPAQLVPDVQPVMQVEADAAYEIFIDGQPVWRFGDVTNGAHTLGVVNEYASPALSRRGQPLELAVRITYRATLYGWQRLPWIRLGDANAVRNEYDAGVFRELRAHWIIWLCNAIMAAAGIFFLAIYLFDRTQRVLLWASLVWLALALIRFDQFLIAASVHLPSRMEYLLYAFGNTAEIFYIAFFFALAGRRINRLFQLLLAMNILESAALILAALLPLRQSMAWSYWIDASPQVGAYLVPLQTVAAFAPLAAFWPINKLPRSQLALYAVCSFWMGMDVLYLGAQIPWLHLGTFFFLSFQTVRSIAIAAVVVAMTFLLIQRIRQTNRERSTLTAELRAAREIQRVLVPQQIESPPGVKVEAVFLPAREVGGDFYRCRVLQDGSQWLLLGDVSGKGVAAGMTGAMLLGACDGHEQESPAEILVHLNHVLCASGVGGLATCLCARIGSDGTMLLANAGHLPPYRNGAELEVQGGLPLGVSTQADYGVQRLRLKPGDMLTFLSDGVVEAQDSNGVLFGFERAREVSQGPAHEIAEVARRFGQRDDITVLKLVFEPAESLVQRF